MEKLYTVNQNKTRSSLWLRSWLLIAKFRLKLKKVGKTTRPFRYDLNQIPYDYTVEVRNRFKIYLDLLRFIDLIDKMPEELWTEICDIVQETGIMTIPKKKKCKKAKWLSEYRSVAQLCPTLCDPMSRSTPGLPVHHHLPEFTQTHVHRVSDGIQAFRPMWSPSLASLNLPHHQGLFQWVSSSHQVAKVLELQHQSCQWIFRVDFL